MIFLVMVSIIFSGIAQGTALGDQDGNGYIENGITIEQAPINPEFLRYQNEMLYSLGLSQENYGLSLGVIPAPVDISHLGSDGYALSAVPLSGYPATYDLRSAGKVTPVRDQGSSGSCWAHASLASLESFLLTNESLDLSENNMKNRHGFDIGPNSGGNYYMSTAYLTRWEGPVDESSDPYDDYSTSSPAGLPVQKHVQDVYFLPQRSNYLDNDVIKSAIMSYGAVYTTFHINWNGFTTSGSHPTSYYSNNVYNDGWHAVTIVGWDDNFDKSNFVYAPPGNGAFIIKNSWGESWGDDGYFYMSYYESSFGNSEGGYAVFTAEPLWNYSKVYQYDPLGLVNDAGYPGYDSAWFANEFTISSSNEFLSAVGFYTPQQNSVYNLFVIQNGVTLRTMSGTIPYSGYHTLDIGDDIMLNPSYKLRIEVKLTTPGYQSPICIEYPIAGYSSNAVANSSESFIKRDGINWRDITLDIPNCNVCLKAYTTYYSTAYFSSSTYSAFENKTSIQVNVTRTGSLESTARVNFTTKNGSALAGLDYLPLNGTLTFNPSDGYKTITVNLINDTNYEPNESFYIELSAPTGNIYLGSPINTTITIVDEDPKPVIQLSPASFNVWENASPAVVNVTVIGSAQSAVYVNYTTVNGTALAGMDYGRTAGMLTINPSETSKTISVGIVNNAIYENAETFNVTLINASGNAVIGSQNNATVSIIDDDVKPYVQFAYSANSTLENKTSIKVNVTLSGAIGVPASINYTTVNGTALAGLDFVKTTGTLTFNVTDTIKTITINLLNDSYYEQGETFFIVLSNPGWNIQLGSPNNTTITIDNDDAQPALRFTSATYNVNENAGQAVIGITITGMTESNISIDYATSDNTAIAGIDYTAAHGTLNITKGMTSISFNVPVSDDTIIDGNKRLNITLSNVSGNALLGTPSQVTLDIVDNEGIITYQMQLRRGWNMVSIPVVNDTLKASDIAGSGVSIVAIFNRSSLGFDSYLAGISGSAEDIIVEPDYGYLFYCDRDTSINIDGIHPIGRGIDIYHGWNMIGWSADTESNAAAVCALLPGDQIIARYNPATYGFDSYLEGISDSNESFEMTPGEGYYIYSFDAYESRMIF